MKSLTGYEEARTAYGAGRLSGAHRRRTRFGSWMTSPLSSASEPSGLPTSTNSTRVSERRLGRTSAPDRLGSTAPGLAAQRGWHPISPGRLWCETSKTGGHNAKCIDESTTWRFRLTESCGQSQDVALGRRGSLARIQSPRPLPVHRSQIGHSADHGDFGK